MKTYLALCELTNQTNARVDFQRAHAMFGLDILIQLDPKTKRGKHQRFKPAASNR